MTEIRRSRSGRPRVSTTPILGERRESARVAAARASRPRPRRRHRDLGRHLRAGAGRDRALPAVRVPRGALRDLDRRARPVRVGRAARAAARRATSPVSGSGRCSHSRTGSRRPASSSRRSRARASSRACTSSSRRCSRSPLFGHARAARAVGGRGARRRRAPPAERRSRADRRSGTRSSSRARSLPGVPDHRDGAVRAALRPARADVPADGDLARRRSP